MSVRALLSSRSSRLLGGIAVAAAGVAVAPAAMLAQHTKPVNPPRIAAIAPPPAQSPVGSGHSFRSGRLTFSDNFPIAVLSDGRVFANFGRGYEQVSRACGSTDAFGGRETHARDIPGTYPV
jgi:hypothetical protein